MKHIIFLLLLITLYPSCSRQRQSGDDKSVKISSITYKEQPHFKIITANATFYLEKSSGGFSSVMDNSGNDWVAFSKSYDNQFPISAAGDYRGIPNMIHGQPFDSGTGHPGFNTIKKVTQVNKKSIRFESEHGFAFSWTFTDKYAKLTIEQVIENQQYWMLYEGPVGGSFNPRNKYWGTDKGMRTERPNFIEGETICEQWQWVYFGDQDQSRVFVIRQDEADELDDVMGFMPADKEKGFDASEGMVVFGFGRSLDTKCLFEKPNSFYFSFYEHKIDEPQKYKALAEYIDSELK